MKDDGYGSVSRFVSGQTEERETSGGSNFEWLSTDEICSERSGLAGYLATEGREIVYPGGGYFQVLEAPALMDRSVLEQRVRVLQEQGWLDQYTAAVVFKFAVASTNTQCGAFGRAQYTVGDLCLLICHADPPQHVNLSPVCAGHLREITLRPGVKQGDRHCFLK